MSLAVAGLKGRPAEAAAHVTKPIDVCVCVCVCEEGVFHGITNRVAPQEITITHAAVLRF